METIKNNEVATTSLNNVAEKELFETGSTTFNGAHLTLDKPNVFCGTSGRHIIVKELAQKFTESIKVILSNEDYPCDNGFQFRQGLDKVQEYFIRDMFDDFWARRRLYIDFNYGKNNISPKTIYILDDVEINMTLFNKLTLLYHQCVARRLNICIIIITNSNRTCFNTDYLNIIECPILANSNNNSVWNSIQDKPEKSGNYQIFSKTGHYEVVSYNPLEDKWTYYNGLEINKSNIIGWQNYKENTLKNIKKNIIPIGNSNINLYSNCIICGGAGSGKTTLVTKMIKQALQLEDIEITTIDPKRNSELMLTQKNYTYTDEVKSVISTFSDTLLHRHNLLELTGYKNIDEYNKHNEKNKIKKKIIVIDEFLSVLNAINNEQVLRYINTILKDGEELGVYLWIIGHRFSGFLTTQDLYSFDIKICLRAKYLFKELFPHENNIDKFELSDNPGTGLIQNSPDCVKYFNSFDII